MNQLKYLLIVAVFGFLSLNAQEMDEIQLKAVKEIEGHWLINLRPSAEAEPYQKEMYVMLGEDFSLTGEFYESEISESVINYNWDYIYFAFTTEDKSNRYYHSAYLKDGIMYGTTYCPSRAFIAPWTGEKID